MALTRPRIFLTPAVLARAKRRAAANDKYWQALRAQADKPADWSVRPINYALSYALTGNTVYADRAIALSQVFIGQGVDAVTGDSGFPCRQVLPEEAITYDFCYDRLTSAQRSQWQSAMIAQAQWVWPETNPSRQRA